MSKQIALTRGLTTIVDDADFAWIAGIGIWFASSGRGKPYAQRTGTKNLEGRRPSILMHRLIVPGAEQVDHVNGDTLDNRRSNLRPATVADNARNRPVRSDSTIGFKGVGRHSSPSNPWRADIYVGRSRLYLGVFPDAQSAARAYDAAALHHFGEFARLNFPEGNLQ